MAILTTMIKACKIRLPNDHSQRSWIWRKYIDILDVLLCYRNVLGDEVYNNNMKSFITIDSNTTPLSSWRCPGPYIRYVMLVVRGG